MGQQDHDDMDLTANWWNTIDLIKDKAVKLVESGEDSGTLDLHGLDQWSYDQRRITSQRINGFRFSAVEGGPQTHQIEWHDEPLEVVVTPLV